MAETVEGVRLSEGQVLAYLRLLGVEKTPEPTLATLNELIVAHLYTVPFQTVALHRRGRTPSLAIEDLYAKIVTHRQGGYCYELNKLFEALLRTLGFDVRPSVCRSDRGRPERRPLNHRAIIATLDGKEYFVDVGFGGPVPPGALALASGEVQTVGDERFVALQAGPQRWKIQRYTRQGADLYDDDRPLQLQTELEAYTYEIEDQDFEALNLAASAPDAFFRERALANIRTDGGHYALADRTLTLRQDGRRVEKELADEAAVDAALEEYFGILGPLL